MLLARGCASSHLQEQRVVEHDLGRRDAQVQDLVVHRARGLESPQRLLQVAVKGPQLQAAVQPALDSNTCGVRLGCSLPWMITWQHHHAVQPALKGRARQPRTLIRPAVEGADRTMQRASHGAARRRQDAGSRMHVRTHLHGALHLLLAAAAGGARGRRRGPPHQLQRPPEVLVPQLQLRRLAPHRRQVVHVLVLCLRVQKLGFRV